MNSEHSVHGYEVRPRKDKRGFDLISDALPFSALWYTKVEDAIDYAKFFSRSHDAVIRVYGESGNVSITFATELQSNQRSTSPITISTLPRITITSATVWPRQRSSSTVRFIKLGGRTR